MADIESSQQTLRGLEKSKDTPELQKAALSYHSTFFDTVNQVSSDLNSTKNRLSSPDAKSILENGHTEIAKHLTKVANEGSKLQKSKDKNVDSFEVLAVSLQQFLQKEAGALKNFQDIASVEKSNADLEKSPPTDDPDKLIKAKKDLLTKLPASTEATAGYREKIAQNIQDSIADLTVLKADHVLVKTAETDLNALETLAQAYVENSSPENLAAVRAKQETLDSKKFVKLGEDIFNGKIDGDNAFLAGLYQKLWEKQFVPAEKRLTAVEENVTAKEKEAVNTQGVLVLAVVEKSWEQTLQPQIDQYGKMDLQNEKYKETEQNLLSDLLKTKVLLAPFSQEQNKDKMDPTVSEGLAKFAKQTDAQIKTIEINREVAKNDHDMGHEGLLKWVKFPTREGTSITNTDEKTYSFTDAFDALPEEKKILIRIQVEEIATKNKIRAKAETEKAVLEFLKPEEKMQKLKEMLGEKGQAYFAALEKLKVKRGEEADIDGAIDGFQAYIHQNFSTEELELHGDMIQDAKEKIQGLLNEKLNQVDDLFSDIKVLKSAEMKLRGNPELHLGEGFEMDTVEKEMTAFRKEILDGKVANFNDRFGELQRKVRSVLAEKKSLETGILQKLDLLYGASIEKDPVKKKEAFVQFAKEARAVQSYPLAQKYLNYALQKELQEASQHLSRKEVLEKMLKEPGFAEKLKGEAKFAYEKMIQENPGLKGKLTVEAVQHMLLEQELHDTYMLELRRSITNPKNEKDPALALYNNWFPPDKPQWYKPWDYGAEEWDQFEISCMEFIGTQALTLGTGMVAGAAGEIGANLFGKAALRYFARAGLSDIEIALIEKGGLQALKASFASKQALKYGASRVTGSVLFEGTTMYGISQVQELAMSGGKMSDFNTPGQIPWHLLESMLKVSVFKAIGTATSSIKSLESAMKQGGAKGAAAWMGKETLSGAGGTILDYGLAKIKGHTMTGQEVFQSMISNYLSSLGMSAGRKLFHGELQATRRMEAAYEANRPKLEKTKAEPEIDDDAPIQKLGNNPYRTPEKPMSSAERSPTPAVQEAPPVHSEHVTPVPLQTGKKVIIPGDDGVSREYILIRCDRRKNWLLKDKNDNLIKKTQTELEKILSGAAIDQNAQEKKPADAPVASSPYTESADFIRPIDQGLQSSAPASEPVNVLGGYPKAVPSDRPGVMPIKDIVVPIRREPSEKTLASFGVVSPEAAVSILPKRRPVNDETVNMAARQPGDPEHVTLVSPKASPNTEPVAGMGTRDDTATIKVDSRSPGESEGKPRVDTEDPITSLQTPSFAEAPTQLPDATHPFELVKKSASSIKDPDTIKQSPSSDEAPTIQRAPQVVEVAGARSQEVTAPDTIKIIPSLSEGTRPLTSEEEAIIGEICADPTTLNLKNNPEQVKALKAKMAPEDFAVLEANQDASPEVLTSIIRGGVDMHQYIVNEKGELIPVTIRSYGTRFLNKGGLGAVFELAYVQKGETQLQNVVVKRPLTHPDILEMDVPTLKPHNNIENLQLTFSREVTVAVEINKLQQGDPKLARHVIRPRSVSIDGITYDKVVDSQGRSQNLHDAAKDGRPFHELLPSFIGAVIGLDALHGHHLAHTDFKPSNIMTGGILIDIGSITSKLKRSPQGILYQTYTNPLTGKTENITLMTTPKFYKIDHFSSIAENKLPFNTADIHAVGSSLIDLLKNTGYIYENKLRADSPLEVHKAYDLAQKLMNVEKHPYKYKNNDPLQGLDPGFVSLKTVIRELSQISDTMSRAAGIIPNPENYYIEPTKLQTPKEPETLVTTPVKQSPIAQGHSIPMQVKHVSQDTDPETNPVKMKSDNGTMIMPNRPLPPQNHAPNP